MDKTYREMARHSPVFQKACELAGIPASPRQFAKFAQQKGLAWTRRREALEELTASA